MLTNYAAEVVHFLNSFNINKNQSNMIQLSLLGKMIESAQHFVLPDNGKILDAGLKGVEGSYLRLPYNTITFECFIKDHVPVNESNVSKNISPKRMNLALEVDTEHLVKYYNYELNSISKSDNDIYILLFSFYYTISENGSGSWNFNPVALIIPSDAVIKSNGSEKLPTFSLLYFNNEIINWTQEEVNMFTSELGPEFTIMLELLGALSCKNVEISTTRKATNVVNQKRIRKGKLPLYEAKELVLKVPNKNGGNHTSKDDDGEDNEKGHKRMHLRRGHIRRLSSGNIWVNAHIVGKRENGALDKIYKIK